MIKSFFWVLFFVFLSSVSAVTFQSGVELKPNDNVTWTINTTMSVTGDVIIDKKALFIGEKTLNITPQTGTFNLSINQWTDENNHLILGKGEDQVINFTILDGTTPIYAIYNGLFYTNGFIGLSQYKSIDWFSTYNLTLNFYDEETRQKMSGTNISVSLISDVFGNNYSTDTGVLEISGLTTDEYIIQYRATDYEQRNYYFSYEEEVTTNLTLYLLNSSTADQVTITVYDTLGNTISGARIKISEYFTTTNSYELVEIAESNFQGEAVVSLNLDTSFYRFIIEYDGEQVYSAGPTIIYSSNLNFYIDLIDRAVDEIFNQFALTGTIRYDTDSERVIYTWNDEQNTATKGCVKVYKMLQAGPSYQGQSCGSSPAGTVYYLLSPDITASYQFKGYITRGGTDYLVSTGNKDFNTTIPDPQGGLFFMFIIMVAFAFLFLWDPIVALIAEGAVPLFFTIAKISPLGYEITIPIFALSIIVSIVIGVNRGK